MRQVVDTKPAWHVIEFSVGLPIPAPYEKKSPYSIVN